jgi:hypothetical protein
MINPAPVCPLQEDSELHSSCYLIMDHIYDRSTVFKYIIAGYFRASAYGRIFISFDDT